jgi:hypothetical protein
MLDTLVRRYFYTNLVNHLEIQGLSSCRQVRTIARPNHGGSIYTVSWRVISL